MTPTPRPACGSTGTARWWPLLAAVVLAVGGCGSASTSPTSQPSGSSTAASSAGSSSPGSSGLSGTASVSSLISASDASTAPPASTVPSPAPTAPTSPTGSADLATPVPTGDSSVSPGPSAEAATGQTLTGTIEPGVESGCVVLQGDDGAVLATLVGAPAADLLAQAGDGPVQVQGDFVTGGMSFCQQGRMFQVTGILPG